MNVAIVGCGERGAEHAEAAKRAGLKVVACLDPNASQGRRLARRFHADAVTGTKDLLKRTDVDIVVVCSPTPSHASWAVQAARAGKHIFCEAPLAPTATQCAKAIKAADHAGVKLCVAHETRYLPEMESIDAQLEGKKIGKVGFIQKLQQRLKMLFAVVA